jgi:alpha-tubulin suppressor-like RCC1 family protein
MSLLEYQKICSPKKIIAMLLYILFTSFSCHEIVSPISTYSDYTSQIIFDYGTAVIKSDGSLWCRGYYYTPNIANSSIYNDTIVKINSVSNIVSISLYWGMAVAADREGNIWCWGQDILLSAFPLIEEPIIISKTSNVKQLIVFGTDVINLNTGVIQLYSRVNLLCSDGSVYYIRIDPANPTNYLIPTQISDLNNISKLSQTLALKDNGTICEIVHTEPEYGGFISGVHDVIDLENVRDRRTVILKKDGSVWAWGQNTLGTLGDATKINSTVPVRVKDLTDVIDISANYDYNLALKKNGTVWFWGYVGKDQNNKNYGYSTPVKIEAIDNVSVIYAAYPCYFMKNDNTYWYYYVETGKLEKIYFRE